MKGSAESFVASIPRAPKPHERLVLHLQEVDEIFVIEPLGPDARVVMIEDDNIISDSVMGMLDAKFVLLNTGCTGALAIYEATPWVTGAGAAWLKGVHAATGGTFIV